MTDEQIGSMVRDRLFGIKNGSKQKIVTKADVKSHIAQGWEFQTWLSDGDAIIKLPHIAR